MESQESPKKKKPRRGEAVCLSFHQLQVSLTPEVRNFILKFLHREDLSNAAMTNKQFRADCAHEDLDQTRCAVLSGCLLGVLTKLRQAQLDGRLGRFKHIKLIDINHSIRLPFLRSVLGSVELELLSINLSLVGSLPFDSQQLLCNQLFQRSSRLLEEVDISNRLVYLGTITDLFFNCRRVRKLIGNNMQFVKPRVSFFPESRTFEDLYSSSFSSFEELYLENVLFLIQYGDNNGYAEIFESTTNGNFPFCYFSQHLKRVSLFGAMSRHYVGTAKQLVPFTQTSLIKFVRGSPNLQWFRSNLTIENITMLKCEFPHIVFLSK